MTYSPLTDEVRHTDKHSSRYGQEIERVNVHHWGGTRGGIERLVESDDEASANYIILDSGLLIASVPEEYRAWTSGSWEADAPAITFELQNTTMSPDWRVSDEAIETLIAAIADIATRYDWPSVTDSRVKGHRDFAATACPGPYLYPRLPSIATDAEQTRTGTRPEPSGGTTGRHSTPDRKPYDDRDATAGDRYEWFWHRLRVDGDDGPITYRAYQRLLDPAKVGGYDGIIDGDFAELSIRAEQRWLDQLGYYTGRIDGWRGPMTIKALQAKLYDDGHYRNGAYSKATMVDADWGDLSVKGLQRYLNSQRKYYR